MKRIVSLILSISILFALCPAVMADLASEEALIKQYRKAVEASIYDDRDKKQLTMEDDDYTQLVDVDGDGKDEVVKFKIKSANPHLRIYYVTENGYYEYYSIDDIYTGTGRISDIDLIKKENGYTLRICRFFRSGIVVEKNGSPDIVAYALYPSNSYITFNAQNHSTTSVTYGFSVDDVTGEYYEYYKYVPESSPKQVISKDEYNKTVTKLNQGEIIPIHKGMPYEIGTGYVYAGTVNRTVPDIIKEGNWVSQASTVHSTKLELQKKLSDLRFTAAKARYAAYTDVAAEISDTDKLQIQNMLYAFQVKDTPTLVAAMSEQEIIDAFNYALSKIVDVKYVDSFWLGGGGYSFYNNSDVENFIYRYTGNRINLKNHHCDKGNCAADMKDANGSVFGGDRAAKFNEMIASGDYFVAEPTEFDTLQFPIIKLIYPVSDDEYLVIYNCNNVDMVSNGYDSSKLLSDNNFDSNEWPVVDSYYSYAIIGKRVYNGQNNYYMIEQGGKNGTIEIDRLQKYVRVSNEPSNIAIDYSAVNGYTESSQYVDYLRSLLEGDAPNNNAKSEIADFIEYAIENTSNVKIGVWGKKVTVTADDIEDAISKAEELKASFEVLLAEKGITLNKNIAIIIKADTDGAKLKNGVTVMYDSSLSALLDRIDGIKVIYDADRQSVTSQSDSIKAMLEHGKNSVKLTQKDNQYTVNFLDSDSNDAGSGAASVTFAFKSSNPYNTVYYEQNGKKKNWSGQINVNDGTIEFMTTLSGVYYVEENQISISDIGDLSEEQQEAIKFMVSRGYFDLADGAFNPYGSLSRYDFTKILVSIFYALDFNSECTFTDVARDSAYYDYIASSQKNGIVAGFEDNTFRGSQNTTREEVISISARTLTGKKGYSYPENTDDYVQFADNEEIAGWENQFGEIALSVREGLIEKGGILAPKANVTRLDAAVILYRLFNLLYDTSPAQIATNSTASSFPIIPVAAGGGAVVIAAGVVGFVFRRKRRKGEYKQG